MLEKISWWKARQITTPMVGAKRGGYYPNAYLYFDTYYWYVRLLIVIHF